MHLKSGQTLAKNMREKNILTFRKNRPGQGKGCNEQRGVGASLRGTVHTQKPRFVVVRDKWDMRRGEMLPS